MFFSVAVTVERSTPATYDPMTGLSSPGDVTNLVVNASVQPLNGRDLMLMPEGTRVDDKLKLYCDVQLYMADIVSGTPSDVVQWKGNRYRIVSVRDYSTSILPHYRCDAAMIQPGAEQ